MGLKARALRSIEKRGAFGALGVALSLVASQGRRWFTRDPFNPWCQFLDRCYDRRHGVDTAGVDLIAEIESDSVNAYSPIRPAVFYCVMGRLDIDHGNYAFIDFGSGKGKALLLAGKWPFRRIIGVEISPRLCRTAQSNMEQYSGALASRNFEIVCADASGYDLPILPCVYYLNNPFKHDAMAAVLEEIRRSHEASPRDGYIVYVEPVWKTLLDEARFLIPVRQAVDACIYRLEARR
jgi:hypothetical protein